MTDAIPQKIDAPPKSQAPRRVAAERQLGTILARSNKAWLALAVADLFERLQMPDQGEITSSEQAAILLLLLQRLDAWRDQWRQRTDTQTARQALREKVDTIAESARQQAQRQIERTGVASKPGTNPATVAIATATAKMAADALSARQRAFVDRVVTVAQKASVSGDVEAIRAQIHELAVQDTKRAKLAARDLVGQVVNGVAKAEAQANGFTHFVWRTQGDDRVRDSHVAKEGRIYTYAEGSDEGLPGQPYGCRCWAEPVRV